MSELAERPDRPVVGLAISHESAEEHVTGAAFEIVGDQQRQLRQALHLVDEERDDRRVAAEDMHAGDVVVDDVAADVLEFRRIDVAKCADRKAGHQHLPDLLVERHRMQSLLDPTMVLCGGRRPRRQQGGRGARHPTDAEKSDC